MADPKQHDKAEVEQRLARIFRGAFAGPPTPLKDIPKQSGESRKLARAKGRASDRATSKSVQPKA